MSAFTPPKFTSSYVYAPYVPLQTSYLHYKRRRGRFVTEMNPCGEMPIGKFEPIPDGTLLLATWEKREHFGITGTRNGKRGIYWSCDGWVDSYDQPIENYVAMMEFRLA